jgi:predicted transcriptional regulator
MTNLEFMKILINLGFVTKSEYAIKNQLDYSNLIGTLSGRKHHPDTLRALSEIGVSESDLPLS